MPESRSTKTSRRRFLVQCSAAASIVSASCGLAGLPRKGFREISLDQLEFSTFARLVGSAFQVGSLATVRLQLIAARPETFGRPGNRQKTGREPSEFSLTFRGPIYPALEQNSYYFSNETVGRFLLFIVPVSGPGIATNATFYCAVFNRLSEAGLG